MAQKTSREDFNPEKMRQVFFDESKFNPSNQRYGLFSYAGTLAISNKAYFSTPASHRDQDGLVKTGPRNFLTSPIKKGKTKDVFFSPPPYSSDHYTDPSKPYLKDKQNAEKMRANHQVSWRPGGRLHEPYSLYESLPSQSEKKFNKKGPDGKVVLQPRNFLTSPAKPGNPNCTPGLLMGPIPEHIADPYDRKKQIDYEELLKHRSKMQNEQFRGNDHGGRFFSKNEELFGVDCGDKSDKGGKKGKEGKGDALESGKVLVPFYTAIAKSSDCFGKYPEYLPDERVKVKKDCLGDKPNWKSTTQIRTIPSPSITCSFKNLRKEFGIIRNR